MKKDIFTRRAEKDARVWGNGPLTLAGRNVLAYVAIIGTEPKGTHVDTRISVGRYTESDDFEKNGRFYKVKPEHVAEYESAPLWRAHAALIAAGFACMGLDKIRGTFRRRKTIRYERIGEDGKGFSATLYPDGALYAHRVSNWHDRHGAADSGYVSKKDAGALPALFTKEN
jgi:hypothetical protein